ncbi:MAG: carbamoyltransferase family protein [Planctomycetaceae bacterium]
MNVLGIGGLGYKDSSAALLSDGHVIAAAAEERFTGTKHEGGFPHEAVRFCLGRAGITHRDLEAVAVAGNPWLPMREKVMKWYGEGFLKSRTANVYRIFQDEGHRLVDYLRTLEGIADAGVEVKEVRHVLSHMAAAGFASPFETAAVLCLDGRGEISTTGYGRVAGLELETYAMARMPDSLGLLYALVADHLGFSDLDDEFRLISISPTGTPTLLEPMRGLVRVAGDATYTLNPDYFGYHQGRAYLSERFASEFGPPRPSNLPLEDRHRDLAASLHAVILEVVLEMARKARERSGQSRLCLAGSLAQNWALVGAICEANLFDDVYVPPSPGDDGIALGAALHLYHADRKRPRTQPLLRADLGPAYAEREIADELARLKLKAAKPADLVTAVAERIARGEIVGWFQGGAEFGPRALGHRSILADPTNPATRARLVASVKMRSEVHPFGLSVAREAVATLFADVTESPFLERTGLLREAVRAKLPAVASPNGRTRVQVVDASRQPLFHKILLALGSRNGVPAALNTSLNEAGRPIATSPRDAIACLYTSGLDALALGPFVVSK